jgi:hypothetical protein
VVEYLPWLVPVCELAFSVIRIFSKNSSDNVRVRLVYKDLSFEYERRSKQARRRRVR